MKRKDKSADEFIFEWPVDISSLDEQVKNRLTERWNTAHRLAGSNRIEKFRDFLTDEEFDKNLATWANIVQGSKENLSKYDRDIEEVIKKEMKEDIKEWALM